MGQTRRGRRDGIRRGTSLTYEKRKGASVKRAVKRARNAAVLPVGGMVSSVAVGPVCELGLRWRVTSESVCTRGQHWVSVLRLPVDQLRSAGGESVNPFPTIPTPVSVVQIAPTSADRRPSVHPSAAFRWSL